jgi:O6-methylguanine-DNA--protein-cysteine methyltransferase
VERIETRAEGVCADCDAYQRGLEKGATVIAATGALPNPLPRGVACLATEGPLGVVLLAASPEGLLRVAFDEHGDAHELRARAQSRRGGRSARAHVERASQELQSYLLGQIGEIRCPIDWSSVAVSDRDALAATMTIPYGDHRSYAALRSERPAYEVGLSMGANPIAVVAPCHRVTRGAESPRIFVGGIERRRWLDTHERQHAA